MSGFQNIKPLRKRIDRLKERAFLDWRPDTQRIRKVMGVQERAYQRLADNGRHRRDLFVERASRIVGPSGRIRVDLFSTMHPSGIANTGLGIEQTLLKQPMATTPQSALKQRIVEDPADYILVVPDLMSGQLSSHDREIIGAGQSLAERNRAAVILLAFNAEDDQDFKTGGADRLMSIDVPEGYAPDVRVDLVCRVIEQFQPIHTLFCENAVYGGDIGRRVAARYRESPATHVVYMRNGKVSRRSESGLSELVGIVPKFLMLEEGVADPVMGMECEARELDKAHIDTTESSRLDDMGFAEIDANRIPLAEADFICSAGSGVSDWQTFHRMSKALGATEGGSRVACDQGQLSRDKQVGASGSLVEPRCYLAFGISGAPQHLQGIERCERVVAINTDLHAQMIKRADLAIVADAQQVMPALVRMVQENIGHG